MNVPAPLETERDRSRPCGARHRISAPWWTTVLGLTVVLASGAVAQMEYVFSGYIVDFPIVQWPKSPQRDEGFTAADFSMNVTRLRLRPGLLLWTGGQLSLEYEMQSAAHGSAQVIEPLEGPGSRQVADLTWTLLDNPSFLAVHTIDRCYYSQGFGAADIVVGRQRIAWGTGRVWNPTDLFNPISPTAFAKLEKEGVDAALAKFHFGDFTDLALVYNPEAGWDQQNIACRFRTNTNEFDLSVMGGIFDRRPLVGADVAGNLGVAGVRAEGILSIARPEMPPTFVKFILGADNQFSPETYALIEYQFNGQGGDDPSEYDLAALERGDILNLGRHYIALSGSYLAHPLVSTSLSAITNLGDGSVFVGATIQYAASDELALALGGQLYAGASGDEYGYPLNTVYLKADLFF